MRRWVVVLIAICALVGCGGPSVEEQAAGPVRAYFEGFASADGRQLCEQLTPEAAQDLFVQSDFAGEDASLGCADLVRSVASRLPAEARRSIGVIDVLGVQVDGDRGTVRFGEPNAAGQTPEEVPVVRVGDRWLIERLAEPPGPGEVSKLEAIRRADRVCGDLSSRLEELGPQPSIDDVDELRVYSERAQRVTQPAVDALKSLTPVERDRELYDRFVASIGLRIELARETVDALEADDPVQALELREEGTRAQELGNRAASAYGLQVCG
jgi:hypothetical protein